MQCYNEMSSITAALHIVILHIVRTVTQALELFSIGSYGNIAVLKREEFAGLTFLTSDLSTTLFFNDESLS